MGPIFLAFGAFYALVAGISTIRIARLPPDRQPPTYRWLPWYHPARRTLLVANALNVGMGLLLMAVAASGGLG
jgi:hypothetical protein